ncbi:glycosyltransferase family 2 protein [Nonomuraea sediminis]|uniref:glycosyltransferase family 2 protein n=1 Tax=Nonomuraea sediminis TaxID=2835864 RepID=UPI001BDC14F6|nr:glycosyltransferase family 2 protein [Nonomuraea sediminis]
MSASNEIRVDTRATSTKPRQLISYVLPVFNEQDGLRLFHERLTASTDLLSRFDFEYVYVNDGSADGSLNVLHELARADERITVIDLSRNFGHQMAITAGIDHAVGDAIIVMDTDLQDPPEVSIDLIAEWESGSDIIYAQRRTRKDTLFKRLSAHLYYRLLRRFADVDIPVDTGDFRLMDRKAADVLRQSRESNRFVRGLVSWMGFKQKAVPFDRDARVAGKTNYPMAKMIGLALDGILSFSAVPLRIITRLGFLTVVLSTLGILYAVTMRVFFPQVSVPGWTLLMVVMWFLGGIQMLSLGVIGEYVGRMYKQTQDRPLYIVQDVIAGCRE